METTKLSLHLNIAMCWLKITDASNNLEQALTATRRTLPHLARSMYSDRCWRLNLAQAIRSCTDALSIDEDNVKALYRRATALEVSRTRPPQYSAHPRLTLIPASVLTSSDLRPPTRSDRPRAHTNLNRSLPSLARCARASK